MPIPISPELYLELDNLSELFKFWDRIFKKFVVAFLHFFVIILWVFINRKNTSNKMSSSEFVMVLESLYLSLYMWSIRIVSEITG